MDRPFSDEFPPRVAFRNRFLNGLGWDRQTWEKRKRKNETNRDVRNREVDESPRDGGTESRQSGVRFLAEPVAAEGLVRSAARETHTRAHHGLRWI